MTLPLSAGDSSTDAKEMGSYTLADATSLNEIKNLIRDVTKVVDTLPIKKYHDTIESRQVKQALGKAVQAGEITT